MYKRKKKRGKKIFFNGKMNIDVIVVFSFSYYQVT